MEKQDHSEFLQVPPFDKLLRRYKKDFAGNVAYELTRRAFAMSRNERRRLKDKRSASKLRRAAARQKAAIQRYSQQKMSTK